ncbi:hypothetical protein P8452_10822 [Trifolium repens]|nr:hypothetical protein P8452_10822 [Trifolium repens]
MNQRANVAVDTLGASNLLKNYPENRFPVGLAMHWNSNCDNASNLHWSKIHKLFGQRKQLNCPENGVTFDRRPQVNADCWN